MWIARWTLIATIIILILGLALQNDDLVEITVFSWHSGEIPVYLVIYFAFAAGMIVFLLLSAYYQIANSMEVRRCRKEMRKMQHELERIKENEAKIPDKTAGSLDEKKSKPSEKPQE